MEVSAQMTFLELTVFPLLAAVIAWFFNERQKRRWEEYQRKEENYKALLRASRGFYDGLQDAGKKTEFLEQLDICWLYCSDDMIRKVYGFLDTVKTGAQTADSEKFQALGGLVVAIRRDLMQRHVTRKTSLEAEDYKLFRAN